MFFAFFIFFAFFFVCFVSFFAFKKKNFASHYYITVKPVSVCLCPLPKFELNQIGHNSVNFEATASRFCMEEDLEEEDEVDDDDDNDDNDDDDNDDNNNNDDTSKNVFLKKFLHFIFLRF